MHNAVFCFFFILLFYLLVRYVSTIMCAIVTLSLKATYLLTYLFNTTFLHRSLKTNNMNVHITDQMTKISCGNRKLHYYL